MTKEEAKLRATPEQMKSFERIVTSYQMEPKISMWDKVLFLDFGWIIIGIEPDGYAHS